MRKLILSLVLGVGTLGFFALPATADARPARVVVAPAPACATPVVVQPACPAPVYVAPVRHRAHYHHYHHVHYRHGRPCR